MIQAVGCSLVAVMGPEMEAHDELRLSWKEVEGVRPEEQIPHAVDGVKVDLRPELVEDVVARRSVLAGATERRDGRRVDAGSDDGCPEVTGLYVGVGPEIKAKRAGQPVDDEVKELVFVNLGGRGQSVHNSTPRPYSRNRRSDSRPTV